MGGERRVRGIRGRPAAGEPRAQVGLDPGGHRGARQRGEAVEDEAEAVLACPERHATEHRDRRVAEAAQRAERAVGHRVGGADQDGGQRAGGGVVAAGRRAGDEDRHAVRGGPRGDRAAGVDGEGDVRDVHSGRVAVGREGRAEDVDRGRVDGLDAGRVRAARDRREPHGGGVGAARGRRVAGARVDGDDRDRRPAAVGVYR